MIFVNVIKRFRFPATLPILFITMKSGWGTKLLFKIVNLMKFKIMKEANLSCSSEGIFFKVTILT